MKTFKNTLATLLVAALASNFANAQIFVSNQIEFSNEPAAVSVSFLDDNSEQFLGRLYFEFSAEIRDAKKMNRKSFVRIVMAQEPHYLLSPTKVAYDEATNTYTAIFDLDGIPTKDIESASLETMKGEKVDLTKTFRGRYANVK